VPWYATTVQRARARHSASPFAISIFVLATALPVLPAQQPPPPPITLPSYQPPVLVVEVPASGNAIPLDKPVVVFRFAAGQPDDAVDPSSLRVWVDGIDRTALFQIGSGQAWGALASASKADGTGSSGSVAADPSLAPGAHLVSARLCSMRAVCSTLNSAINVMATVPSPTPATGGITSSGAKPRSTLQKLLDVLLAGARRLLQ